MAGLVLEGGAFRGLFTAGVLDGLLEIGAMPPYVVGVSAGATNACSYLSLQKGRNLRIMERFLDHPRYLGWRNFLRGRAVMDMDFVFDEIPNRLDPFDYDAFGSYPGRFLIGVYQLRTGKNVYFERDALDKRNLLLRASCSIPVMFPFVKIGGELYADGGLGDPIPVERAMADGNERNLVVLTQPRGYQKHFSRSDALTCRLYRRRYPFLARTVEERYRCYNRQLALCEKLEEEGRAMLLFPSVDFTISRFEKDKGKLRALYQNGLGQVLEKREELLSFMKAEELQKK